MGGGGMDHSNLPCGGGGAKILPRLLPTLPPAAYSYKGTQHIFVAPLTAFPFCPIKGVTHEDASFDEDVRACVRACVLECVRTCVLHHVSRLIIGKEYLIGLFLSSACRF